MIDTASRGMRGDGWQRRRQWRQGWRV